MAVKYLLSNHVSDARVAMAALIESRALSIREDEPEYPTLVADLAWRIADAMDKERAKRAHGESPNDNHGS